MFGIAGIQSRMWIASESYHDSYYTLFIPFIFDCKIYNLYFNANYL